MQLLHTVGVLILFLFVLPSNAVLLDNFFPFGIENQDSIVPFQNMTVGPIDLPYEFPYFDHYYRQIWIGSNGVFSFGAPKTYQVPCLNSCYNTSSLIAGFWLWDGFLRDQNDSDSSVYYQIYSDQVKNNRSALVFGLTRDHIQRLFPSERLFQPKFIVIGTWYRLNFYFNNTDPLNNTFQMVLTSDGDRTFVFFLYHELQWANPYNYTYYDPVVGFYNFESNITRSFGSVNESDFLTIVNDSNVNNPGLFAFRIDVERVNQAGCDQNSSFVSFRPQAGSLFGGTTLLIHGPCFTNRSRVKCRFNSSYNSEMIDGFILDEFRAACLTPGELQPGQVLVEVFIDDQTSHLTKNTFYYSSLRFGSADVIISTGEPDPFLHARKFINLTWHFPLTVKQFLPNTTKINIELWPFSFDLSSHVLTSIGGIYLRENLNFTHRDQVLLPEGIQENESVLIRIVARLGTQTIAILNSGIFIVKPLPARAIERCQLWATMQSEPDSWNRDQLLQCPMNNWQANLASRCCYEIDPQCFRNSRSRNNCWLHQARPGRDEPSAVECFTSIYSNRYGASAECCYDINGTLITRGTGAGSDNRYHGRHFQIRHFFHDRLPYLHCCTMNNDPKYCDEYLRLRPPRRGSNTMGESGRMWGDPHFGTLDGFSYTFNGYGEYVYLAITNGSNPSPNFNNNTNTYQFLSHIRTVPLSPHPVTITRGFAARSNLANTKRISFTISQREKLEIYWGDDEVEFEETTNQYLFVGLTLNRLDGSQHRRFSLVWDIGIVIEIEMIEISGRLVMSISAFLSEIYKGKTYGLLGTYDGNSKNDLRASTGRILPDNATLAEIHRDFGMSWAINGSQSLFHYSGTESAEFYQRQNIDFIPSFVEPSGRNNARILETCGINSSTPSSNWSVAQRACLYDFSVTNNSDFASASRKSGEIYQQIRENQKYVPEFNKSLPLQRKYKSGDFVTFVASASSRNPSAKIQLSVLHQPNGSLFNDSTGQFTWNAIEGDHYLKLRAQDSVDQLYTDQEYEFKVTLSNSVSNRLCHQNGLLVGFLLLMVYIR